MLKVDFHNHYFPLSLLKALDKKGLWAIGGSRMDLSPNLYEVGKREADRRKMGADVCVLSVGPPGVDYFDKQMSGRMARFANDEITSLQDRFPGRFYGLATLPLQDVESSVEELDRCVRDLRFGGAMMFGNVRGKVIDSEDFWPIYQRASELDVPILLHPTKPVCSDEFKNMASLIGVGFLFDTTLAIVRLVFSGVLERFPKLKIVVAHLGSFIPYILPRIDIETKLLSRSFPDASTDLKQKPSHYFRKIYVDSVSHHAPALRCCIKTLGPERIVLGSDYPYSIWYQAAKEIERSPLPKQIKNKILGGNAVKLLKISKREVS